MQPLEQLEATLAECFGRAQLRRLDPDDPRFTSHGEVEHPRGVNARTGIPERGGLLCARIFGTVRSQSCLCTKYQGPQCLGITCEKCGVMVAEPSIRRERFGHWPLPPDTAHPWDRSQPLSRLLLLPAGHREQDPSTAQRQDLGGLNGLYQRVLRHSEIVSRCHRFDAPSSLMDHETTTMQQAMERLFGRPRARPGRGPTLADHIHRAVLDTEPNQAPSPTLLALLASADLTLA